MPKSRPLSGWISEHSVQISGPADMAKPTMNISSIATVKICVPWSWMPLCIIRPTTARPTAITVKPV